MRTSMLNRRTEQRFRQAAMTAVGSIKMRLILGCFTILMLFVLANRTPSYLGWDNDSSFAPESPASTHRFRPAAGEAKIQHVIQSSRSYR